MRKILALVMVTLFSFTLVSCKTNFSKYASKFVMTSYVAEETDVEYDFELITIYEIELLDNGYAQHKLQLGLMEEPAVFSNHYDINLKKKQITFYIKQGLVVLHRETWDYVDDQIIMKELYIPIVDEPDPTNESHYVSVDVTFTKETDII